MKCVESMGFFLLVNRRNEKLFFYFVSSIVSLSFFISFSVGIMANKLSASYSKSSSKPVANDWTMNQTELTQFCSSLFSCHLDEFNGKGPTYGGKGRSQGYYKLSNDSETVLQAPEVVCLHMVTGFLSWLIHYVVSWTVTGLQWSCRALSTRQF